jgi:hypothetical protein
MDAGGFPLTFGHSADPLSLGIGSVAVIWTIQGVEGQIRTYMDHCVKSISLNRLNELGWQSGAGPFSGKRTEPLVWEKGDEANGGTASNPGERYRDGGGAFPD